MRDYIYTYSPNAHEYIFSGLEYADISKALNLDVLVLLKHQYEEAELSLHSNFDFCYAEDLLALAADELYSYGDLVFSDAPSLKHLEDLPEDSIAELLYFAHKSKPLGTIQVPGLNNKVLVSIHDNGFYAHVYFSSEKDVQAIFNMIKDAFAVDFDSSDLGTQALWLRNGVVEFIAVETNIDAVLNQRLS